MKLTNILALAFLLHICLGCSHQIYQIELTPDGTAMQRKLTVWSEDSNENISPFEEAELKQLANVYGAEPSTSNSKNTFTGRFEGQMPHDIGGAGSYTLLSSPLGTTHVYSERFRDSDDMLATIEERQGNVDQLIDLWIGWIGTEVSEPKLREQLQQLLDDEVRRDLTNACLYFWAIPLRDTEHSEQALTFYVGQYFIERGYFDVTDGPRIARIFFDEDQSLVADILVRIVARKLGIPAEKELPAELAKFRDSKYAGDSLKAYAATTDRYQDWLAEQAEVNSKSTDPGAMLGELLSNALLPDLFQPHAQVDVKLHCGTEPDATNGEWSADEGVVTWSERLGTAPLPTLYFAAWSEPDAAAQRKHLGKVALTGERLAKFITWYCGLSAEEAAECKRLLAQLSPGPTLQDQLSRMQFPGNRKRAEARNLLLKALEQ
ncbi:MAG: hypothetical protein R3C53_25330 [Pirellulaceae bacterium]